MTTFLHHSSIRMKTPPKYHVNIYRVKEPSWNGQQTSRIVTKLPAYIINKNAPRAPRISPELHWKTWPATILIQNCLVWSLIEIYLVQTQRIL